MKHVRIYDADCPINGKAAVNVNSLVIPLPVPVIDPTLSELPGVWAFRQRLLVEPGSIPEGDHNHRSPGLRASATLGWLR